jgi:dipeptidyl aminopeptidase/acylaminoacyl peptidase
VAALSKAGLVDHRRIGLVGFSRAGYNILYTLTHPDGLELAAALIDDSFTGSFASYLMLEPTFDGTYRRPFEGVYGGPFWESRESWMADETSFNADRVQTPVMLTLHGEFVLPVLDIWGALRLNRRPVEVLHYPRGSHQLHSPKERLASYNNTVDWMKFWLTQTAPSNQSRADRWTKMRSMWRLQKAWEAQGGREGSAPADDFQGVENH